jgi:UDPglucose 6-dehydrogenase
LSAPVVGFAGMTHLGLVSAAAAAGRGCDVVAFDPDANLIAALRRGALPVSEPGLPELIERNAKRLHWASGLEALARCDIVYVAVDVPTDRGGHSELAPVRSMIARATGVLAPHAILVILSQVPPGFTRALAVPAPRLYYQVETLVFGRAVERATEPERFIVGAADPRAPLPTSLVSFLQRFGCPVLVMRYESAELAKISINCCLVASLAAANMLAEVSEAIGADWGEIVPALRLDRRIGPHAYLDAGLGIAGGNLERDLRAVLNIAKREGADTGIVQAWLGNSTRRKEWTWRILRDRVLATKPGANITILGLAYKENTRSTKNSPALALLDHLHGCSVTVHDPVVPATVVPWAQGASDPLAAATGADALVVTTPWPQYRDLKPADLAHVMAGRVILDPYRTFDMHACTGAGFVYHTLGMAPLGAIDAA